MSNNNAESENFNLYSGDTTNIGASIDPATVFLFTIEADAEPDVFARIANCFNLANVAPLRATLQRKSSDIVKIAVEIGPLSLASAEMINRKISQLTCVHEVTVQRAHARVT
jgi:hypothetical protein